MQALPAYDIEGSGPPVLVMHGWGGCAASMRPVVQALTENGFSAIVPDFHGHGRTPPPPQAWDVDDYAAAVLALLDELRVVRCDIVAHSFGGRVALVLASGFPDRVGRMVLTGCAGVRPKRTLKGRLRVAGFKCAKRLARWSFARKLLRVFGIDVAKKVAQAGSADYRAITDETLRQTFVRVVNQDLTPRLAQIKAPAILLWGRADTDTPMWMGETMQRQMQDAALIPLEGGHFAYLEQSFAFQRIMLAFFKNEGRNHGG